MSSAPDRPGGAPVLVTWPGFDPDDPDTGGLLRRAGLVARLAPKLGARTPAEVCRLVSDAVGAIVSSDPFDRSVFAAAPQLRVIARVGVGTDTVDLQAATEAGVAVTTTPGVSEETVADHALAMMLAAIRRIVEHDASVRAGEWSRAGPLTPWDLHGRTVGLVGFGRIGRAVARRLRGFDTHILVRDPVITGSDGLGDGLEVVDLDELLRRADIISLHVPLLPTTRGLIGRHEIARMRSGAIVVNTSRGGVVDEVGLAESLASGRLRAAALDVFEDEPPRSSPLLKLPNVILTPHVAGLSVESMRAMVHSATQSVVDVLAGRATRFAVNPAAFNHHRFRCPPPSAPSDRAASEGG
ncbi:MAG: phosphoglycerate dehydrogenase [Chloroflexi bacterium]|nr:phosphoglycerate dehydrogenase [Chloroflexota bacterium]